MFDDLCDSDIADDYAQLLRDGFVVRLLAADRHERWRAAIRAKARQDKLAIRTHSTRGLTDILPRVYASLVDRQPTLEDFLASIGRLGFVDAHGETDLDAWQEWFFTE